MSRSIPTVLGVLALAFHALAAAPAAAVDEVNVSRGATVPGPGLAAHGYDVVAYFTDARPVAGSAEHSVVYEGATYRFASREHAATFERNPSRYAPAYGGYCAYGVSVGKKFDGDPRFWRIENDRLFLNLNAEIQRTWEKDVAGNVTKADDTWKRIESAAVADL